MSAGFIAPGEILARALLGLGLLEVAVPGLPVLLHCLRDPAGEPVAGAAHRDIAELADDPDRRQHLQHHLVNTDS